MATSQLERAEKASGESRGCLAGSEALTRFAPVFDLRESSSERPWRVPSLAKLLGWLADESSRLEGEENASKSLAGSRALTRFALAWRGFDALCTCLQRLWRVLSLAKLLGWLVAGNALTWERTKTRQERLAGSESLTRLAPVLTCERGPKERLWRVLSLGGGGRAEGGFNGWFLGVLGCILGYRFRLLLQSWHPERNASFHLPQWGREGSRGLPPALSAAWRIDLLHCWRVKGGFQRRESEPGLFSSPRVFVCHRCSVVFLEGSSIGVWVWLE